jgi:hypothetical protein
MKNEKIMNLKYGKLHNFEILKLLKVLKNDHLNVDLRRNYKIYHREKKIAKSKQKKSITL